MRFVSSLIVSYSLFFVNQPRPVIWRMWSAISWHFEQSPPAVADPLPMFTAAPLPAFTDGPPPAVGSPSSQSDDTPNELHI